MPNIFFSRRDSYGSAYVYREHFHFHWSSFTLLACLYWLIPFSFHSIRFVSFHLLSSHEFHSLLMSIDVFIANVIIIFYAALSLSLSLSSSAFFFWLLLLLLVHYNFIYHLAINSAQQKHSNNLNESDRHRITYAI